MLGMRVLRGIALAAALGTAVPGALAAGLSCGQPFTAATGDDGGSDVSSRDGLGGDAPADTQRDVVASDGPGFDAACTDCSNAACSGVACEPAAPNTWALATYERGSRSPCPPGWGSPSDVVERGGLQTCGCQCSGGGVSCDWAGINVYYGSTACPGSPNVTASPTTCTVLGAPIQSTDLVRVDPLAPQVTPCTAQPTNTKPPESQGRLCMASTVGGGCGNGQVCVGEPGSQLSCIVGAGDQPCPHPFVNKRFEVASGWNDTRECSPSCNCSATGTASCQSEEMTFYYGAQCNDGGVGVAADTQCLPRGNIRDLLSGQWSATPVGGGCTPAKVMPVGDETPNGPVTTVCCL
jgi:hypothetical protein